MKWQNGFQNKTQQFKRQAVDASHFVERTIVPGLFDCLSLKLVGIDEVWSILATDHRSPKYEDTLISLRTYEMNNLLDEAILDRWL